MRIAFSSPVSRSGVHFSTPPHFDYDERFKKISFFSYNGGI